MNFFRRRKNRSVEEPKDDRLFKELYAMLKTHGDAILRGDTKLSLTAPILILLNGSFQKITEGVNQPCFQVATQENKSKQVEMIYFIFDFIQKVISFKLVAGAVSSDCPLLSLHYFKALQIFEIKKVPIKYLKNLHSIRRQLVSLTCCRSTNSVKEVVEQFGKEDTFILPVLTVLDLSYNTITDLQDVALKLLPALESLNLSYNCIKDASSTTMPSVSYLNLGYNTISTVPILPQLSQTLTNLILRNNNLTTLEGMQSYSNLTLLDLTANCLIDFQELAPLAYLEKLVILSLIDNPICFNSDYRIQTIRKLSPVKRMKKITLDGKELDNFDQYHLGEDVEPVPLSDYLPDRPLGKPKVSSLIGLANNLSNLTNNGKDYHTSTPVQTGRIKARVRQASIADSPLHGILPKSVTPIQSSQNSTPRLSVASIEIDSRLRSDSLNNMYSSRRSSVDNSLIWVNKTSGSMKQSSLNGSASELDYDSWPVEHEESQHTLDGEKYSVNSDNSLYNSNDYENGVYHQGPLMKLSTVENQINNAIESSLVQVLSNEYMNNDDFHEHSSGSSLDQSDTEFDVAYLVQNIIKSKEDSFSSDEIENLFVSFKLPYLCEKTDDGKLRNKLDLDYLQKVTIHEGDLRLSLRFDLIRIDWQVREYIFEQKEQLDSFLEVVRPIEVKNYQKKVEEMKNCECLKCGTIFLKRDDESSLLTCPKCSSNMVIDKNKNKIQVDEDNSSLSSYSSFHSHVSHHELSLSACQLSSTIQITLTKTNGTAAASWPPIVQPCGKSTCLSSSAPSNFLLQSLHMDDHKDKVFFNKQHCRKISVASRQSRASDKIDFENIISKFKTSTYRTSPSLSSPSSVNDSYGSRQPSRSSVRSKTPRSCMNTPVIAIKGNLLPNHEDYTKCDHRLKLFLTMNVYKDTDEVYLCQIRCTCISYNKMERQDCLLNFSNKMMYIFSIVEDDSEIPEDCLKKLSFCSLHQLKYVNYGYFNQSFSLEFSKAAYRFKFLTCDSERTNKFLRILKDEFKNIYPTDEGGPIFSDEHNKQTTADIRKQIFSLKESPVDQGERILNQLSQTTHPSILTTKKIRLRSHQQCFVAKELLDWLCARREVRGRQQAIETCQRLLDAGIILHVTKEQAFRDDDAIYKFVQKQNTKNNPPTTMIEEADDDNELETSIQIYTIANVRINEHDSALHLRTILFTTSHAFLLEECHQWPLSRLHPPPALLRDHYVIKECSKITNIIWMEFYDDDPCYALICFTNENGTSEDEETHWLVNTETISELNKMTSFVKRTWEALFAIELTTSSQPSVVPVLDSYILV